MRADILEKAIANCLTGFVDEQGYSFFADQTYIGIVEAGYRDKITDATTILQGFLPSELPAIRVWADAAPGSMNRQTTNENDIQRTLVLDVIGQNVDVNTLIEDCEEIRQRAAVIMRKQVCFSDGFNEQRDLLSQKSRELGGLGLIVKEVIPMPYRSRKTGASAWTVQMSLQVIVFYIESY